MSGRLIVASALASLVLVGPASADEVLPGFSHSQPISGLKLPSQIEFAPGGRVFVGELSGRIKVLDDLDDPSPTLFADLREEVHAYHDRGLLGLALDPGFPIEPYVYVLYTRNAVIGGPAPLWAASDPDNPDLDDCPDPPGGTDSGCVVSGRLARLTVGPGGTALDSDSDGAPDEQVLVDGWCQQFDSHSVGDLEFGADGYLYASGGDGANYNYLDYGQAGSGAYPPNPCGDPPTPAGTASTPKLSQGGALRSQDLRTAADATGLNGAVIRVDAGTGNPAPTNPLFSSGSDANAKRILAYGLRNPFRFAIRPGSGEVWVGDVGQETFEEINRIPPAPAQPLNFGWPCYEGAPRQPEWDAIDNDLCEDLYAGIGGSAAGPFLAYRHNQAMDGEGNRACPPRGSGAVSGVAFAPPTSGFPGSYDGALFVADITRNCIASMRVGDGGDPDPQTFESFITDAGTPVDLEFGPDGALYYADIYEGAIERVEAITGNVAPVARLDSGQVWGPTPLSVDFDASASTDANGDELEYRWDLDGDGAYDDSTAVSPTREYTDPGVIDVGLEVRDVGPEPGSFETDTDTVRVFPGDTPPDPVIAAPGPDFEFAANKTVAVAGSATDAEDEGGEVAPDGLDWVVRIAHCPGGACHEHPLVAGGGTDWSFTAPDHEYPSHLNLTLTATDSWGLAASRTVRIDPRVVRIALRSDPRGMKLSVAGETALAPFGVSVIRGSGNLLAAVSPRYEDGRRYVFRRWSDGGSRVHQITAGPAREVFRAFFERRRRR